MGGDACIGCGEGEGRGILVLWKIYVGIEWPFLYLPSGMTIPLHKGMVIPEVKVIPPLFLLTKSYFGVWKGLYIQLGKNSRRNQTFREACTPAAIPALEWMLNLVSGHQTCSCAKRNDRAREISRYFALDRIWIRLSAQALKKMWVCLSAHSIFYLLHNFLYFCGLQSGQSTYKAL